MDDAARSDEQATVEITPAMEDAGIDALIWSGYPENEDVTLSAVIRQVYSAMRALDSSR